MGKPVELRRLAADDIDTALAHYLTTAGHDVATRFIDEVERSLKHIARHPAGGSLRSAYELDLPDLRNRPIAHFPYLVFYLEHETRIDVWRMLHTRRHPLSTTRRRRLTAGRSLIDSTVRYRRLDGVVRLLRLRRILQNVRLENDVQHTRKRAHRRSTTDLRDRCRRAVGQFDARPLAMCGFASSIVEVSESGNLS